MFYSTLNIVFHDNQIQTSADKSIHIWSQAKLFRRLSTLFCRMRQTDQTMQTFLVLPSNWKEASPTETERRFGYSLKVSTLEIAKISSGRFW